MHLGNSRQQRFLEIALILIIVALTCLLYIVNGFKMVVLNLFYLPVVLAAFFLGRYRAGVLGLLCVISASVVTILDLGNFAAFSSPIAVVLAVTIWGAVLGLNALLVGTLSDERADKLRELHDAYVGVVEVLSRYLNSADPRMKDRARRVSELSQQVAARMKLSDREIDDIRVASLLQDVENIEITAKVIRKAMGNLKDTTDGDTTEHTFHGSDLMQSLGSVLTGALPLLLDTDDGLSFDVSEESITRAPDGPFGAKVIRTVNRFDTLMHDEPGVTGPADAIAVLRDEVEGDHHPAVLHALTQVVLAPSRTKPDTAAPEHDEAAVAV
jgi:hypothetical protein